MSHIAYIRKKEKLQNILSKLKYTGEIPTKKTAKAELSAIRELIDSIYQRKKIVNEIQYLNKKIPVTVNFDKSHLKSIQKFLRGQVHLQNELRKIESDGNLGIIVEDYKNKINEIKYDYNQIEDINKATNILENIKKELDQHIEKNVEHDIQISERQLRRYKKESDQHIEKNVEHDIQIYNVNDFVYSYGRNRHTQSIRICKILLNADKALTEFQIQKNTGFKINIIREILYDLFGKSLITAQRKVDDKKEWFVYVWTARLEIKSHIQELEVLIQEELQDEATKLKLFEEFSNSESTKF